ncbi:hypothetical protein K4A83_10225 [Spirulina subsalsa FACHB-351]|uniref:Uncharacterized protein n=1 Tax=Spirulina subsalsa FACHB-351 TaxID=234711 RepID=A0ABT3L551_9CYAN|nr:hypothetical protein [Spirulina subsalsa]MCW6036637.1 hypothetical protein [Spirulina subsalsa FACHB-351]
MLEKLKELADKHEIPLRLLLEALELEQEKVMLQNRRIVPKLRKLIESYI